jgi:hypothetical protein
MQNGAKMKFYFLSFGFEILPKIPSHYYLLYDDEKNKYYMLQTCLVPFMRQFKFWATPRVSAVYHVVWKTHPKSIANLNISTRVPANLHQYWSKDTSTTNE